MCEVEMFCQRALTKRFSGVPVYDDVREIGQGLLPERPTVLAGGFPCQGISSAGRGLGLKDDRSGLWHEMLRVIALLEPQMVLIENVRNLLSRGMSTVLTGLRAIGYDAEWDVIPAAAVGAAHLRERVWIIARPKEYAEVPVYGNEARKKKSGVIEFDIHGKIPRAGRMNAHCRELEPIAPRKTKRKDGWTYWVGVNLWPQALPTLPTPHGICVPNKRYAGPSGNELGNAVNMIERSGGLWGTPNAHPRTHTERRVDHGEQLANQVAQVERGELRCTPKDPQVGLADQVVAVEGGQVLWPSSSSSRDHKDTGDLNCVEDNGLLPRRVFHVEQGTALLPTPDAYGNGNGPENHMRKKAERCGGPRNTISNLEVIARNGFAQANGRLWPTTTTTDAKAARNETAGRSDPESAHHSGTTLLDALIKDGDAEIQRAIDSSDEVLSAGAALIPGSLVSSSSRGCWPTPSARLGDSRGAQAKRFINSARSNDLDDAVAARTRVNGSLNPDWTEWLMGFPLGWTDLNMPNELLTQTPWWYEPYGVPRVALGIKDRSLRLRAIGNAVVWPCAYIALERGLRATNLIR